MVSPTDTLINNSHLLLYFDSLGFLICFQLEVCELLSPYCLNLNFLISSMQSSMQKKSSCISFHVFAIAFSFSVIYLVISFTHFYWVIYNFLFHLKEFLFIMNINSLFYALHLLPPVTW